MAEGSLHREELLRRGMLGARASTAYKAYNTSAEFRAFVEALARSWPDVVDHLAVQALEQVQARDALIRTMEGRTL